MRSLRFSTVMILGTDTEVGKTYQAARLVEFLANQGRVVGVYKPVASGTDGETPDDADQLRSASGRSWPPERVCPQKFSAPLAPPVAAAAEGTQVEDRLLYDGIRWWTDQCEYLVVEGAGGVLSPLSQSLNALDLAQEWQCPIILVAANRLGMVNHTLLSLEAIRRRDLHVVGVVINSLPNQNPDLSVRTNRQLLESQNAKIRFVDDIVELATDL